MTFQPSSTLRSPTFMGLILAQITAAFNDQAIHITAFFFASDILIRSAAAMHTLDEKTIVAFVTGCFITPFILFSPLAGQIADKYSKRRTLVAWKLAEVLMMAVGLFGLLLPTLPFFDFLDVTTRYRLAAGIVVGTVFLMGTHSAFFIPAKYGVMPEILKPAALSRGNGLLEGTSFVAQILGTCFGAAMYIALKKRGGGAYVPTDEWIIGAVLLGISLLGAAATLFIAHMPAAAPETRITLNWWTPIARVLRVLHSSRPLLVAVLGIGFLAFMTLFMRQSLLYEGEMKKNLEMVQASLAIPTETKPTPALHESAASTPTRADVPLTGTLAAGATAREKAELRLAVLLAFVGLGIGIGSVLAGILSGKKLELGLVLVGGVLLVVLLLLVAYAQRAQSMLGMSLCLVGIGAATGLYVVPLYTLMQDRAPKSSKGNMVAISNVVNMIFGMVALGAFYLATGAVERVRGLTINPQAYNADSSGLRASYLEQLQTQVLVPSVLFLLAAGMTIAMFFALGRLLPDLVLRSLLWLRSTRKARMRVDGVRNIPMSGPAVIASSAGTFEANIPLLAAADRRIWLATFGDGRRSLLERLAGRSSVVTVSGRDVQQLEWAAAKLVAAMNADQAIGMPIESANGDAAALWARVLASAPAGVPIIPAVTVPATGRHDRLETWVCFGEPVPSTELDVIVAAVRRLETAVAT
jgi:acyl-[acyl-carrier-protein]-phospholipid O-acyltransferase/long-chain-fatty-acid--[acyl-carrier-protein] ligase